MTDYLAGMMVAADAPILEGMEKRTVSGGQFAVFECNDHPSDWGDIFIYSHIAQVCLSQDMKFKRCLLPQRDIRTASIIRRGYGNFAIRAIGYHENERVMD